MEAPAIQARPAKARRRLLFVGPVASAAGAGGGNAAERRAPLPPSRGKGGGACPAESGDSPAQAAEAAGESSIAGGRPQASATVAWRLEAPGQQEIAAMGSLRGDVTAQIALLGSLGFPEPLVVPVESLDRLASLQRARKEWLANSSKPRDPELANNRLTAWNDRDPLSRTAVEAVVVPLSQAVAGCARVAFAALAAPREGAEERPAGGGGGGPDDAAPPPVEPMAESPARVTAALALLASQEWRLYRAAQVAQHALGPHVLLPSLAAPLGDARARASAQAARPLYVHLCHLVATFGPLPTGDARAAAGLELLDLEPHLVKKERTVVGLGGGVSDAEAVERCDRLWEAAERIVAAMPRKALPRFRALAAESAAQQAWWS